MRMIDLCGYTIMTSVFYFRVALVSIDLFLRYFFFFFSSRRRHTRYIGDWSSDVCSSDLVFVADAAKPRRSFALRGPFGPGIPVYATLIDTRGTPRLYASSCNPFFGMKVLRSTDMGKSFSETKSAPAFPKDDGRALANIWSLEAGDDTKDLWCGVEPASLFRSRDGGDSWDMVPGISNHDHARKWQPGNGGLCMHTIIRDGNRVHLGISTGGHYLSEDGGETFRASNQDRKSTRLNSSHRC